VGPVSGGLRYRHVGGRPADEANEVRARGYTLVETFASCPVGALDLTLAIDNLLDAQWNEAQFATTSRLKGEPSGITELNFTPGAGRSVQVGIGYRF
jgi:outer membrane receptor protein involved in Fe transport